MAGTFYLRIPATLPSGTGGEVSWFDQRDLSHGISPLSQLAQRAAGCRVIALAPAREVVILDASLPTSNRQRLIKALPYALEEQFASDVEALHFAFAFGSEKGHAKVALVARERIAQWLAMLEEAGLKPRAIYIESLGLPLEAESWSLLVEPQGACLRTAPLAAIAQPADELAMLLRLSLSEAGEQRPKRLHYAADHPEWEQTLTQICQQAGVQLVRDPATNPVPFCYRGLDEGENIDLMQGEFSRRDRLARHWKPWRAAAALLPLLVLLQLGNTIADYLQLKEKDRQLAQQIEQLYRTTFPEARNLVNPRLQMEQQLAALSQQPSAADLLGLLSRVAPLLTQAPSFRLEALRYRDETLEIDMQIKDFQSLDALKAALQGLPDMAVTIASANAAAGQVRSQIQLQPRGGA